MTKPATKPSIKLSATTRAMLTLAATRPDRLVRPPQLPTAAARQVVRSLLNQGVAEEVQASIEDAAYAWRTREDGTVLVLRATDAGFAAAGLTPAETSPAVEAFTQQVIGFLAEEGCNATILDEAEVRIMLEDGFANSRPAGRVAGDILAWLADADDQAEDAADTNDPGATTADMTTNHAVACEAAAVADALDGTPAAPTKAGRSDALRHAAAAVLEEWDDRDNQQYGLPEAIERLRAALAQSVTQRATGTKRAPRQGTKQEAVLALLRRTEGATLAQITETTGWQPHTVRGFLAGLKKKGIKVETLERVRMVGPNKEGAKGSYSIYHITD